MSEEIDDNRFHLNSSFDRKQLLNNSSRDVDVNVKRSRLLSNDSNESQDKLSISMNHSQIDEYSNGMQRKSPDISQHNSKQTDDNELLKNSFHFVKNNENDDNLPKKDEQNNHFNDQDDLNQNIEKKKKNSKYSKMNDSSQSHSSCEFSAENKWLDPQWHEDNESSDDEDCEAKSIKKPDELEDNMEEPSDSIDEAVLNRIQGSIIGMALGDALGAHVEFRPRKYMEANPVKDLVGGGTWGLHTGQFTDDTSMALCLANSLLARHDFIPYDQLVRYKWWYRFGYMSSTGQCFDIGAATSQSLHEFERRQKTFAQENEIPFKLIDKLSNPDLLNKFNPYCSEEDVAGNGALMRLAPVPLFFYRNKYAAIEFSGRSGRITHGDKKSYDACRFYGALIVAALRGFSKKQILAKNFYSEHRHWFGQEPLHEEIEKIALGSYKRRRGYLGGIRGKGYIVKALEAALWAFWSDNDSFEEGALAAVNLGDDTDTTAAIYGQLAGAFYGYKELPPKWVTQVYAHEFLKNLSKWIAYEGKIWESNTKKSFVTK